MNEEAFHTFLIKNNVEEAQATIFIAQLQAFEEFLQLQNLTLDSLPNGKILEYTERLVNTNHDAVLNSLEALLQYSEFAKLYDITVEVLDIWEAFNAMDNLCTRVGEHHGEKIRDVVFADIELPPLGVDPLTKHHVTKIVMKRLEDQIGEAKTIELLAPCLHGRPLEPSLKDREKFLQLNDLDTFLDLKHQELIERFRQHQKDGTLEWAQFVDDEVIAYVENTPTISPGMRVGDQIISTKIPYQIKAMLGADDTAIKRFNVCYCPWVRGAIKDGTETEISTKFCYCSAGFTKKYWDVIFDQPVKVEPIETALSGALHCKFAVQIPKEYQK